jgi:GNAT superfamily N-acetyltransferase
MHSISEQSDFDGAPLPQPESAGIRGAVASDIPALSRVLADAFDRDPFINWLISRDERRAERMEWTFEVMLRRLSSNLNETYTSADLSGAAIWKRPGEFKLPLTRQLLLLPAFARAMGWRRIPAFLRLLEYMEALHERLVPEPHFYLFVVGVSPSEQRRGLGGQLLEPVLALCDREQQRAYLETSREDNLSFYMRHGFRVAHVVERPEWPKFWLMLREPGAPPASGDRG